LGYYSNTSAQSFFPRAGGGNLALAKISASSEGQWSAFLNPAGLSESEGFGTGIYASNLYSVDNLYEGSAVIAYSKKSPGAFALGFYSLSASGAFQYSVLNGTYARRFEKVKVGVQFYFMNLNIPGYGSAWYVYGALGMQYKVTEDLEVGAVIYNPSFQDISIESSFEDESLTNIPTILNLGLKYSFSEKVKGHLQLGNSGNDDLRFRVAMEYFPDERLGLRGGVSIQPIEQYFGVGADLNYSTFE